MTDIRPHTQAIIDLILAQLQDELQRTQEAADEAHHAATHDESVAETQYDTLGLEASYLAEGQSRRVHELQNAISLYHQLHTIEYSDDTPAGLGALVILEAMDGGQRQLFIGPAGGGAKVSLEGQAITVLTPASPLGETLLHKEVGDEISIADIEYELIHIC